MMNLLKVLRILIDNISPRRIAILIGLILVVNILELLGLSMFVPIIDLFQDNKFGATSGLTRSLTSFVNMIGFPPVLSTFLLLLSFLFFVKTALIMCQRYLSVSMAANLQDVFRARLFHSFLNSRMEFINENRQGVLLSVLSEHTIRTAQAFFVLIQMIALWITVAAYGGFALWISWKLTLVALLLGLGTSPLISRIGRIAHGYGKSYTRALEDSQHRALEGLHAKKLVNAMNWSVPIEQRFRTDSTTVRENWKWMAFWSNSPGIIIQPISVMILSVIIWMSIRFSLSVALLGAFVLAFIRLLPTVQNAVSLGADYLANKSSLTRVFGLLKDSESAIEPNGNLSFSGFKNDIRIMNVRYCRNGQKVILDGLSIDIRKGQIVALVGPSGTGKTTIADLILGLYHPDSGQILIDGTDLSRLDLKQYRSYIAYVPQEPILFNDSIRNNLIIGLERMIEDEELKEVCEKVGAWEFITQRKEGLRTVIGDRGVQLSGGQRQRLALARALLRNPEIMILDEATSALDNESDQWVKNLLSDLRVNNGVTIIIIAHRFTTIEDSDLVYEIINCKAILLGNWEDAKIRLDRKAASIVGPPYIKEKTGESG